VDYPHAVMPQRVWVEATMSHS